jgi:hypothetical protein
VTLGFIGPSLAAMYLLVLALALATEWQTTGSAQQAVGNEAVAVRQIYWSERLPTGWTAISSSAPEISVHFLLLSTEACRRPPRRSALLAVIRHSVPAGEDSGSLDTP